MTCQPGVAASAGMPRIATLVRQSLPHPIPQLRFLTDGGERVVKAEQGFNDFLVRIAKIIPIVTTYSTSLFKVSSIGSEKYCRRRALRSS
jgi:hypothetical protein